MVTVGIQGSDYVIMVLPRAQLKVSEDEAKRIRNFLVALLGAPTDEEIGALG